MDSSVRSKALCPDTFEDPNSWQPHNHSHRCHSSLPARPHHHHHHHHHFHVSPHCPVHSYMLHVNNHSPIRPLFNSHPLSQIPEPLSSVLPLPNVQNSQLFEPKEAVPETLTAHEENVELEEEEEEDPVFVLTDEWAELFAKSEAKRRLEKKQAKKKGK